MSDQDEWATEDVMDSEDWYVPEVATFGDQLVAAREQAKLSQADLARKLGVRKATLANWEDDLNEPRANKLQTLCGLLGVSLKWLLTGEGEEVEIEEVTETVDHGVLAEIREIHAQLQATSKRLAVLEKRLRAGA
jgi:transcriptional regulator with XRE-family HTH domain